MSNREAVRLRPAGYGGQVRLRPASCGGHVRLRLAIRGAVQGVGFRPFIYRLASDLGLAGWVSNGTSGVRLEVEGSGPRVAEFLMRVGREAPPRASIQGMEPAFLDPAGYATFEIRESDPGGEKTVSILPDIATCADCLREILDPHDRRFRYPFTNCTNCGPRYSIIESLPYDRAGTTMRAFGMCDRCRAEYVDPRDRRYHAQPIACPDCGPRLSLWNMPDAVSTCIDEVRRSAPGTYPPALSEAPVIRTTGAESKGGAAEPSFDSPAQRRRARSGRTDGRLPARFSLVTGDEALLRAARAIREGEIVAVKGLGGFHLLTSARREDSVRRLRERKHREEKPLALMYPSIDAVRADVELAPLEERLLQSPEAPIVLVRRAPSASVAPSVAPGNPCLGIMLPYTPLHHLLLREIGEPVVATSGNVTDEPICTNEREALDRLSDIADRFLVHDRPIAHRADDSVARVILDREQILRRARGYAPLPIDLDVSVSEDASRRNGASAEPPRSRVAAPQGGVTRDRCLRRDEPVAAVPSLRPAVQMAGLLGDSAVGGRPISLLPDILAVGGHLKNSVAITRRHEAVMSPHVGDLDTPAALAGFREAVQMLTGLYDHRPLVVACDLHPDYPSTRLAGSFGGRVFPVQHHHAHALACLADNGLSGDALAVTWDGTGYGPDGTIWGGEFLLCSGSSFERVAHLRPFRLPGGEAAVREPRRSALGVLFEMFGAGLFERDEPILRTFTREETAVLHGMLSRGVNSPLTSSAGRLFDAVAALARAGTPAPRITFEGQAAMELEFSIEPDDGAYPIDARDGVVDWAPAVEGVLRDRREGVAAGRISARFHNALVEAIVGVARTVGQPRVLLTGGCFQNRYLTERSARRLEEEGFRVYIHQRVPPNDGGLALGQAVAAALAVRDNNLFRCGSSAL